MVDLVVIGGGLAGATAALEAKHQGLSVVLAARSWGATALSTGALDAAYSPALSPDQDLPRSVADHVKDITAHRPRHPYGVLGFERSTRALRDGFARVAPALQAQGLVLGGLETERENHLLPSSLGTFMPAASAASAHLGGPLAAGAEATGAWGVLQLAGEQQLDATRVAAGLAHDARALTGKNLRFEPLFTSVRAARAPVATARMLDDTAEIRHLAAAIRPQARDLAGLIVPPVIGLRRHRQALLELQEQLGLPVVEALAHVPSVPGLRLQMALDAALRAAEIPILPEIEQVHVRDRRVAAVAMANGEEVRPRAVTLATGRFIAGGVGWRGETLTESLLGLPVSSELGLLEENSPHPVVRQDPEESHPLMTAGVMVNERLQPMQEGVVAFDNVFAAGMVIGGFASRYVLCADGVALSTGVLSARAAVEHVASAAAA